MFPRDALVSCYTCSMSSSATLTIRLDSDIKNAARQRAEQLGVTLSTVVENELRRFINGHPVIIDGDSFVPSELLRQDIAIADSEHSLGDFDTVSPKDIDSYFDDLSKSHM